jgi:hypothetical protein
MKVRNNKSKSTMSKSEEHEAGKRSAIGARIVRMKVKSNRNKNTKNKNEEQ